MMNQYLRLKADHADAILLFHLGDFYEAFFEDAETVSRELDIVLTARNGHPMAGVPLRRGDAYIAQLLRKGYKVAVCQQLEDPRTAKGLVKRAVVRVVTPGTAVDDAVLDAGVNNYLAAVDLGPTGERSGLAFLDLSTGEFTATEAADLATLHVELARRDPSEVLLPDAPEARDVPLEGRTVTRVPATSFSAAALPADAMNIGERALRAAGAILAYVLQTQRTALPHIRPVAGYATAELMTLDPFTVASLELVRPMRPGQERGTLLAALDRSVTPMGRRLLRRWILSPLADRTAIERRLDAVTVLVTDSLRRENVRARLADVHDLERLLGKLGTGRVRPFDLLQLVRSLDASPRLAELLDTGTASGLLEDIGRCVREPELGLLSEQFSRLLVDPPPADARDGGIIRPGHSEELDRLRDEARLLRDRLSNLEAEERARTGISSLKVGYNRVFGYYFEVTRTHLDKVPPEYMRRQTLANAERFVTEELRGCEERIASIEERSVALEMKLFDNAVEVLRGELPRLQRLADALSELDAVQSLADVAHRHGYTRPSFTDRHVVEITAGRHPVVERIEEFVPNDLVLSAGQDLVILTGPNMAGKSVYLRQTALMSIMAQVGSFVPATRAVLPLVDRVFARVGASDMLVAGVSTFMMEMLEVATILERATARSLIILDEMGRGTSTFDGVSIAWAVAEELARKVRAKTLFATHYHELTRLAEEIPNVVNLHVAVKEVGKDVVFLHRVEPGTASGSYGVHVARLAGLPAHVTDAADRILADLLSEAPLSRLARGAPPAETPPLFGAEEHPVLKALRKIDVNRTAPLDALARLAQWKAQLGA